jgi:hypothetical protein
MKSRVFQTATSLTKWVSPDLLEQEDVWGADLFCGSAAQILFGKGIRKLLKQLGGNCLEGWRVSTNPRAEGYDSRIETTPVYRQSNLDPMRFKLEPSHWQTPQIEAEWCVQPGDVVLNKLLPIRAVLVTDRTYRHPIDANCLLIRGLDRITSAWVAFCLNQKPYEAYLTQHQGLAVLPRASLGELRQLRVPPVPDRMRLLGEQFWQLNDAYMETEEAIVRCMREVEEYMQEGLEQLKGKESKRLEVSQRLKSPLVMQSPPARTNNEPYCHDRGRFLPADAIEDSLLPSHVENAYWRRRLQRELGWVPISKLSMMGSGVHERLDRDVGAIPYIQLNDIDRDLMVGMVTPAPVTQATRIFKEPLSKGEVLLSTFAANPKVVFVDRSLDDKIYVTDHWKRLRFLETPAAWAAILNAEPVREQLAGLAMGSIQQFIYADRLTQLMVPLVPLDRRRLLEQVVFTHHQRKRELNQKWHSLWDETLRLFNEVHELPNRSTDIVEEGGFVGIW